MIAMGYRIDKWAALGAVGWRLAVFGTILWGAIWGLKEIDWVVLKSILGVE